VAYDVTILLLAVLTAICSVIGVIPIVRAWFPSRQVQPGTLLTEGTAMPDKPRRFTVLLVLFIACIALAISLIGLYRVSHYDGAIVHFQNSDEEHLKYVHGKRYINEEVKIDGIHFDDCTFENATLTYEGTDVGAFSNSHFSNIRIKTDSDAVSTTVSLLKLLGFIKDGVPVLDKDLKPVNPIPGSERIH